MEQKRVIYPTLEKLMEDQKIRNEHLAVCIGKSVKTVENKLNGITPWNFDECVAINVTYFPKVPIMELFEKTEQAA